MQAQPHSNNNGHEVFVHPFVRPDHWEIADLWAASWDGMPAMDPHARYDWLFEHIEKRHEAGAATFCALNRRTGGIAGFAMIEPNSGNLLRIIVASSARGNGVASALLDRCKRACANGIRIAINPANERAVGFFLREGFAADDAQASDAGELHLNWQALN